MSTPTEDYPKEIFLQGEEGGYVSDTTWCQHSVNDTDVRYVLLDSLADRIRAALSDDVLAKVVRDSSFFTGIYGMQWNTDKMREGIVSVVVGERE